MKFSSVSGSGAVSHLQASSASLASMMGQEGHEEGVDAVSSRVAGQRHIAEEGAPGWLGAVPPYEGMESRDLRWQPRPSSPMSAVARASAGCYLPSTHLRPVRVEGSILFPAE